MGDVDSSLNDEMRFGGEFPIDGSVANDDSLSMNGNDFNEIALGQYADGDDELDMKIEFLISFRIFKIYI